MSAKKIEKRERKKEKRIMNRHLVFVIHITTLKIFVIRNTEEKLLYYKIETQ